MKSLVISLAFCLFAAVSANAVTVPDSVSRADSIRFLADLAASDSSVYVKAYAASSRYDHRVRRYRKSWEALIPTHTIVQYAGNMGLISAGVGWDYGHHRQWETDLLFGFLPKFNSRHNKLTMTLKGSFVPWNLYLRHGWMLEPLSCGLYANTVFGSEFWSKQPRRYPDKYYEFLSTKVRLNICFGQRVGVIVPRSRRKLVKSVTTFYEVSTCDLYVRSLFQGNGVRFWDILSVSFGVKFQML